jgi:hypothetical protein
MLIRQTLPKGTPIYDLLDHRVWLDLNADPTRMRQEIDAKDLRNVLVVVDEIQKLPVLLDEIHLLIETRKLRFLLTGSSARKLRRSGVNLLGGRARSRHLHPLSWKELGPQFVLLTALNHGLLPSVYFSDDPAEDLRAYVGAYLKEEITAEGLTRNVPAFARFLEVAAACSGKMFNKTEVANDAQVPRTTVIEYFEILKDTLIGHELPAWGRSQKRKAIETAKFYLFDVGVARAIQKLPPLVPQSPGCGPALRPRPGALHLPRTENVHRHAPARMRSALLAQHIPIRGRLHPWKPHRDRGEGHPQRRRARSEGTYSLGRRGRDETPAAGLPGAHPEKDRQDPGPALARVPGASVVGRVCPMTG